MRKTIEELLQAITSNTKKKSKRNKRNWYRLGRYILNGNQIPRANSSQIAAKRTYQYYRIGKGNWEGPTPRQLAKMNKEEFERLLKGREENRGEPCHGTL